MTEYIERVIRPRMSTIPGVAQVQVIGAANYSMRIWIDPVKLAARGLTAAEVLAGINAANFLSAAGKTQNEYVAYSVAMKSTLQTPEAFAPLPLKAVGDEVVRLGDVATVELGAKSSDTIVTFNGTAGHVHRRVPDAVGQSARHRRRLWSPSCRRSRRACRRA